jgi:undecaprenyl-diphosphatase
MDVLARFLERLRGGRPEPVSLLLIALLTGAAWAFVELADEVHEGETQSIDERVLLALRAADDAAEPIGPRWIEEVARDVTALGGFTTLGLIAFAVCGLLWLLGKRRTVSFILVASFGALILNYALKGAFGRPRPDLVPHGSLVYTTSFPSGHSLMATAIYLTLGALLAQVLAGRGLKIYVFSLAVALAVLVGLSRVYLGVHWPSDVLAGWSAGAAWALLCWFVARRLQRHGWLDSDSEDCGRES